MAVTLDKGDTAPYELAGAASLSRQPSAPDARMDPHYMPVEEWQILRGHLEQKLNSLRTWRSIWWTSNWSQLAMYIEPKRSIWLTQSTGGFPSPNNMTRGRPINSAITDPTGTYAARVCAAGIMSGLASPSRPWFKFVPAIKNALIDAEGREWIDEVEDRMYTVMAGSNFYNSFAQECMDNVVFGSAPSICYEDEVDVVRFYNPTCGEYYLSAGATTRVEGLSRAFLMTVEQMIEFFGVENCPADVRLLWRQKGTGLQTERIVAHSIEPNYGVGKDKSGQLPGGYPWRETYWIFGSSSEGPLALRGFFECPFTVARWSIQSNDAYGRSVGMDVLPDILQLQVETARKAEAIEKMVRPPLLADMQLKNQPSSSLPGHVTYVASLSAGTGMRPIYEVNPDIGAMERDLAAIQKRIQQGFFNDILMMISNLEGDRRSATEITARNNERLQVLGPVIENIINDGLRPKLKRIFSVMKTRGLIPPMPKSLRGVPLDIEFVSMLALAQKASATGGIERLLAMIGNMVSVFPQAADMLNVDEAVGLMNRLLDNPEKLINAPEVVAQMRQARAQQQQQMQAQADAAHAAATVNTGAQAAQTLAGTQIGGGRSALAELFQ